MSSSASFEEDNELVVIASPRRVGAPSASSRRLSLLSLSLLTAISGVLLTFAPALATLIGLTTLFFGYQPTGTVLTHGTDAGRSAFALTGPLTPGLSRAAVLAGDRHEKGKIAGDGLDLCADGAGEAVSTDNAGTASPGKKSETPRERTPISGPMSRAPPRWAESASCREVTRNPLPFRKPADRVASLSSPTRPDTPFSDCIPRTGAASVLFPEARPHRPERLARPDRPGAHRTEAGSSRMSLPLQTAILFHPIVSRDPPCIPGKHPANDSPGSERGK